jgi:hypothetical protein
MKEELSASVDLKKRIASRIDELKTVTFAELRWIPGFRGEKTACISQNVVVWTEISSEAISAINELIEEGSIEVRPYRPGWQGVMTYGFDGGVLPLPLAKAVRPYKRPRWLPVYLAEAKWSRKVDERFNGGLPRRGRPPKKRFLKLGDN